MGIYEDLLKATGDPDGLGGIRERILAWMLPGFMDRAEVIEAATEYVEGRELLTGPQVEQLVDELWRQRLDEQKDWPERTDADKVAAAFAELDAAGIVARMNFTCCQTCGSTEIDDERPADRPSTGYVFFHSQDGERLADNPAHLFLAYGAFDIPEPEWLDGVTAIGNQVAAVLRAHDLPVTWNGSSDQRIQVGPLNWQRRLPTARQNS
ncbi:hypothetical protein GCM10009630_00110 [Kribbella jejuensis]|uniref:DUF6891 domain-containing protein n=1 Tax=Kribbella jejuensis TaxID=236068 RepID=A0A542E898_9ACTN|nr:hypothetical protein [Kribbella jejuensis]TQJ11568.1 hypothetical protein FB475_4488 [Kribbella jejuensis]